jgi:DNA-binding response OmpR family regulator
MAPAKEYAPSSVMRVLVVEDSVPVAQLLDEGLSAEGHTVDVAETLEGARAALREGIPDILVLDRMLPDGDGLELVDELRAAGNDVPVILLTAIADVDSRVKGLKSGADDYLTKPFSFEELLLRLDRLLYRRTTPRGLVVGPVRIDPQGHRVWVSDNRVSLTAKEFALLLILATNAGRVITSEQLLNQVWGMKSDPESNLLAVHFSNLRNKLGPQLIHTVRGVGYVLDPERED